MAFRHWSTSASGNASVVGINWAEGQPPSTVNDSAREVMAQLRRQYRPDEWEWVAISNTASVASQTSFRVSTDLTSVFHAQRRVRLQSTSTIRYATVVSSSFTAETTVTVTVDAGSLSASHSIAALGPSVTNPSARMDFLPLAGGTLTGNLTVSNANAAIGVNCTAAGQTGGMYLRSGSSDRWSIGKGNGAESGANVGSDFFLNRFADNGTFLGTPFSVNRATGDATFANRVTVASTVTAGSLSTGGSLSVAGTGLIQGQITTNANEILVSNPSLARNRYNTGSRAWTAGMFNTLSYAIADETGGQQRLVMDPGGDTTFTGGNGVLKGPGVFWPSFGVGSFLLRFDGASTIFEHNANCYSFYTRASGNWGWVVNGSLIAELNSANGLGFRSVSNAKAWVCASINSIQSSHNVSSIAYNAVGDYTIGFTYGLPNANYAVAGSAQHTAAAYILGTTVKATGSCGVQVRSHFNSLVDNQWSAVIFATGVS